LPAREAYADAASGLRHRAMGGISGAPLPVRRMGETRRQWPKSPLSVE
jgi:hypothetical protein